MLARLACLRANRKLQEAFISRILRHTGLLAWRVPVARRAGAEARPDARASGCSADMLCYGVLPTDARLAVVSRFQHLFMGRPQRSAVHTVEQVTSLFAPSLRKQLSARRSALSPDVVAMLCQGALLLVGSLTDQLGAFGQIGSALASSLCEQFLAAETA